MNEPKGEDVNQPRTEEGLRGLAAKVGFKETPDLAETRNSLYSSETIDEFKNRLKIYLEGAEAIVDKADNQMRPKAQIGLTLITASNYYANGMLTDSSDAVKDAWQYAYQMRDDVLAREIAELWFNDPKYTYKRKFPQI